MKPLTFETKFLDEKITCTYVTDPEAAREAISYLSWLSIDDLFGLDVETAAAPTYASDPNAALSPLLSSIRLMQVFDGDRCYVFDLLQINDDSIFIPFLESRRFIAHNALFEIQFLLRMGVKNPNVGCTYIIAQLLFHANYPTDEGLSASLEKLIETFFRIPVTKAVQNSNWGELDLTFEQVEYAALDAIYVLRLAEKFAPTLSRLGLDRIYKLTKDAQIPVAQMQINGLLLDVERHRKLASKWRDQVYEAKKKVLEETGLKDLTSDQLAQWLSRTLDSDTLRSWPKTPGGKLSTDSHTFADYDDLPVVKPYSDYQKAKTLASTFGEGLIQKISVADGRLHARYKLLGARTGRLSCANPNLQNLPRDSDVRKNFVAEPGYIIVCSDYSQIELRVAAEISQDEEMLRAYKEGIDLHSLTASKVANKNIKDVTKADRQMAKAVNFGLLFGLGAKKFSKYARQSYGVDISEQGALEAIETWRATYAGYRQWQIETAQRCEKSLIVKTPCGKIRKLSEDDYYGACLNTGIQGGAAEVMLYALIQLQYYIDNFLPEARISNVVHDEISCTAPINKTKELINLMETAMVNGYKEVFPKGIINGLVETKFASSWGEAK